MAEIGQDLSKAKAILDQGDVVGIPTETVYGLAGNALDEDTLLKIYSIKNRPKFDPIIAHTDSIEKIKKIVLDIPETALKLTQQFWPGPLTILLKKKSIVPDLLTSGLDTVAIRIPNHPLSLKLLRSLDYPLAAPSANPFGYVSPTSAKHVNDQLGTQIPYILDGGNCSIGLESTIIGFEKEKKMVYRLGGVTIEKIEQTIGEVHRHYENNSNPRSPGMLKSHYSPRKKIILGTIEEHLKTVNPETTGVISFSKKYNVPDKNRVILSKSRNLNEAARNIFTALRQMDQAHIQVILAEYMPEERLGRAINDRLKRAATSE